MLLKSCKISKVSYTVHGSTLFLGNLCYQKKGGGAQKRSQALLMIKHSKCGWKMNPEVSQHPHENFRGLPGAPTSPGALGSGPAPSSTGSGAPSAARQHHCIGLALVQLAPRHQFAFGVLSGGGRVTCRRPSKTAGSL